MPKLTIDHHIGTTLRYRWSTIVIATIVMSVAFVGVVSIGVTNNYLVFFRDDNPQIE